MLVKSYLISVIHDLTSILGETDRDVNHTIVKSPIKSIMRELTSIFREIGVSRLNLMVSARRNLALSEIYGMEAVDRAIQDGIAFAAYSCEYIANILETG